MTIKIHPAIKEILNRRGIEGEGELEEFFSSSPAKTYDPFLLPDVEEGMDMVLDVIDDGGKICIYGDYDADGVTSASLLMSVIGELTDNIFYYLPSRFHEGYGLHIDSIEKIKEAGASLIITVDCGSVSRDEVEYAKQIGLKMVVTDHHTVIEGKMPDCPVINPMRADSIYPFKNLAGVGVAFKFAQALTTVTGLPKEVLVKNMDLLAIGTVGDIMPLVDENRTMTKYGLRVINLTERKGLNSLIQGIGLEKGTIKASNLSFGIVPYINAAGRMGSAMAAAELMQSEDEINIEDKTRMLIDYNNSRKEAQDNLYEICAEQVKQSDPGNVIILRLRNAHEGITGIVAGKLKDHFKRPTIIITSIGDGMYKGTSRSTKNLNMYNLLDCASHLFETFGGHSAACGFTLKEDNIDEMKRILYDEMTRLIQENPDILKEEAKPEIFLSGNDIDFDFLRGQEMMEPFGAGNPRPRVGIEVIPEKIRRMGNRNQYLGFYGAFPEGGGISCVVFNDADEIEKVLKRGGQVRLTGYLDNNRFNGRDRIQMKVLVAE